MKAAPVPDTREASVVDNFEVLRGQKQPRWTSWPQGKAVVCPNLDGRQRLSARRLSRTVMSSSRFLRLRQLYFLDSPEILAAPGQYFKHCFKRCSAN